MSSTSSPRRNRRLGPWIHFPVMILELESAAEHVTTYALEHDLHILPVAPTSDGPTVEVEPEDLDLAGFLAAAAKFCGGLLYVRHHRISSSLLIPDEFRKHAAKIGELEVAFVFQGVLHFWAQTTAWYDAWLEKK